MRLRMVGTMCTRYLQPCYDFGYGGLDESVFIKIMAAQNVLKTTFIVKVSNFDILTLLLTDPD